jgi:hypothetical protein
MAYLRIQSMHQNTYGCLSFDLLREYYYTAGYKTNHLYCVHHVVYHEGY